MMNLTKRIALATLAVAATLGAVPATSAQAATSVNISYRDYDRGGYRDYRGYDRRDFRRDNRRWDNRRWDRGYNRYDNRRGWNSGYRYRDQRRCWTQWQYNRWQDRRVPVRVCR